MKLIRVLFIVSQVQKNNSLIIWTEVCGLGSQDGFVIIEEIKLLRSAIKHIPLDRLMIETDCPYLIPKNLENKIMGNTNLSGYLSHILKDIAELIGKDEEDLSLQIFENSLKFFNQKI